jgi:mannose-6-phosphate isomerase-like protein (cupin superfamily)
MKSSAARLTPTKFRGDSPMTGETFEFVSSSRTADDQKFRFVWTLGPGKRGPGEHLHPEETETFEIVSGVLRIWIGGVARDYRPGDVVAVEPGTPHRFLNPGAEPAVVNVSLDGSRLEDALVPLAVACEGRTPRAGDVARMFVGFGRFSPSVPTSRVGRAMLAALAAVLRMLGFKPYDPVYGWDRPEPGQLR